MASELESDLQDTVGCGRKWLVDFNAGKNQLVLFDQSFDSGPILWKWMGLFSRKNWLFPPNWNGTLLLKLHPGKLELWFVVWSFFLLRLLCISINLLYSSAWNTVVMSWLVFLVATWNFWVRYKRGYAGLLILHFLAFMNPWNPWSCHLLKKEMPSVEKSHCLKCLFYRYYFDRCSSELAEVVPLPYSRGRSTHYSERLHDFSVIIPRCYKDVYANSFSPRIARAWNSLLIESFLLTYDLSGLDLNG